MKTKLNIVITFCAAAALALLASCQGSLAEKDDTPKTVTVGGSISIASAVPSSVAEALKNAASNTGSSRTATSSLSTEGKEVSFSVDADKYETTVDETGLETKKLIDGSTCYGTVNTNTLTYSIPLTSEGEWKVTAILYVNSIAVLESIETVTVESVDEPITKDMVLKPSGWSNEINGSVDLTISDQTGKISKVRYCGTVLTGRTQNPNFFEEERTADFTNGTAKIQQDDVNSNCYEVTFFFEDANGNIVFRCKESVAVFSGFTTDTWFGNSTYFKQKNDGSASFAITDSALQSYGTQTVPNSQYVLYSYYDETIGDSGDTHETGYRYWLADSADTAYKEIAGDTFQTTTSYNSFTFDADGNVYLLNLDEENSQHNIYSSNQEWSAVSIEYNSSMSCIIIDRKTNALYSDIMRNEFYLFENLVSTRDTTSKKYEIETNAVGDTSLTTSVFAVYDNVLYIPQIVSVDNTPALKLLKADMTTATYSDDDAKYTLTLAAADAIDVSLSDITLSNSATISDALYQDGAVYMLLRDVSTNNSNGFYSRGAVIRYDVKFGTVAKTGWSDKSVQNEDMDENYKMYAFTNDGEQLYKTHDEANNTYSDPLTVSPLDYIVYDSSNESNNQLFKEKFPSFYSPNAGTNTLSDSAFYGPEKFIAIKPKKLVISDEGLCFYTNGDGIWSYKNVNRAVTVDLESFAIESTSTTAATFEADLSGSYNSTNIPCAGSGFLEGRSDITENELHYNSGKINIRTNGTCFYLGIKEGQE